jgi:FkbM family methyltransferase
MRNHEAQFPGATLTIANSIKNRLLKAGPRSPLLLQAFRLQAALHGVSMRMADGRITLTRGSRQVVLGARDIISVPFVVHEWDKFFATLEGQTQNENTVLDFSQPALHRYRGRGLSFYAPSLAEDDSMDAYTASYCPQPGDVVWDVGAHAGLTSYFLAEMVGPTGKVFAFEPDDTNYEFLLRNIDMHQLASVTPVKAALSDKTGTAIFCMDGTMSAGLTATLSSSAANSREVKTLGLQDACEQFGSVPTYIKMDIEGAELSVVASSLDFLKQHPIHFSIESNHLVDGKFTSTPLEKLFAGIGYRAWSSDQFGQLFTWAEPPQTK